MTNKQARAAQKPGRATQLFAAQGVSEYRKGGVQISTVTAERNSQRSDANKSAAGVSSLAAEQGSVVRRPFAVFDIDGTLIRWQLYHAVAETLAKLGHIDPQTHAAIREARMLWKKRTDENSFKQYEEVLVRSYDQLITQLSVDLFMQAAHKVFDEYKDQAYTYTRQLILDLKQQGYILFAISGSQTEIVALIAGHYGFDDFVGSTYTHKNGFYTGNKIVAAHSKHKILEELVKKHGVIREGSVAVGDSASDSSMLETADQPIAFNPDKSLYQTALKNGWKIVVERKNVVYELEKGVHSYELSDKTRSS